jgi:hypothetical protein
VLVKPCFGLTCVTVLVKLGFAADPDGFDVAGGLIPIPALMYLICCGVNV